MSFNFNALRTELVTMVAKALGRYGFEGKARSYSFIKPIPNGRQAIHLGFIRHKDDFDVTADVALGFDALENIIREFESSSEDEKGYSMGAELGNISGSGQMRWTVTSTQDIPTVAESIMQTIVSIGFPYLQRYSRKEEALAAMKGDDRSAWLHMPVHDARARRALGLAFLLGRGSDELKEIADAKVKFLGDRKDPRLESFLRFKEFLSNLPNAAKF